MFQLWSFYVVFAWGISKYHPMRTLLHSFGGVHLQVESVPSAQSHVLLAQLCSVAPTPSYSVPKAHRYALITVR